MLYLRRARKAVCHILAMYKESEVFFRVNLHEYVVFFIQYVLTCLDKNYESRYNQASNGAIIIYSAVILL